MEIDNGIGGVYKRDVDVGYRGVGGGYRGICGGFSSSYKGSVFVKNFNNFL